MREGGRGEEGRGWRDREEEEVYHDKGQCQQTKGGLVVVVVVVLVVVAAAVVVFLSKCSYLLQGHQNDRSK